MAQNKQARSDLKPHPETRVHTWAGRPKPPQEESVCELYVGYFKTAQQTTVTSSNLTYGKSNDKITVGCFGNTCYLKKRFLKQRSKFKNEKKSNFNCN